MEPLEQRRSHRAEARFDGEERQKALAGLPAVTLGEEEAARFLKALEQPDDRTVARLAELRHRAR